MKSSLSEAYKHDENRHTEGCHDTYVGAIARFTLNKFGTDYVAFENQITNT